MNTRYQATLSPKERLVFAKDWRQMLLLYKSGRFLTAWSLMFLIPVVACLLRWSVQPPVSIIGFLIVLVVSGGAAAGIVSSLMTGEMCTNHGLFRRTYEPLPFWLFILLLTIGYIAPLALLLPDSSTLKSNTEQAAPSDGDKPSK
jgi:hypothetical protein